MHEPTLLWSTQCDCAGFVVVSPSAHDEHSVALAALEYLPSTQSKHRGELNSIEYCPAGQSLQRKIKCLKDPGLHAPPHVIGPQQVPSGHFPHVFAPGVAAYIPPAHVAHCSEKPPENFPGAHSVHFPLSEYWPGAQLALLWVTDSTSSSEAIQSVAELCTSPCDSSLSFSSSCAITNVRRLKRRIVHQNRIIDVPEF